MYSQRNTFNSEAILYFRGNFRTNCDFRSMNVISFAVMSYWRPWLSTENSSLNLVYCFLPLQGGNVCFAFSTDQSKEFPFIFKFNYFTHQTGYYFDSSQISTDKTRKKLLAYEFATRWWPTILLLSF